MIILISEWLMHISPAATAWSNYLPWQCQHYKLGQNFACLVLVSHSVAGKDETWCPVDGQGFDGVVAFVRLTIRETQTCSNDYVCTQHISIFIINQNLSF